MKFGQRLRHWLEFWGGAREAPPNGRWPRWLPLALGVWWGILGIAIAIFCGQATRFIYIDF